MKRYLLDTNIFLFSVWDDDRLTKEVREILDDYESLIYIPSESLKETINLFQCNNISAKQWKCARDIIDFIANETDFKIKYAGENHFRTLAELPRYKDHGDPFDRMIIAHAISEKITLISSDRMFPRYKKHGLDLISNF